MSYRIDFHTKWSDFDPNKHMRHSAYNDYAAEARIRFMTENNFGIYAMEKINIGPVLFSEYTLFKKEVKMGEDIYVDLFLEGVSKQGERFKIMNHIYRSDGVLVATISCYIAWIDLHKRKLTVPPKECFIMLNQLEKTADFQEIVLKSSLKNS